MIINSFLGNSRVVAALLDNEKAVLLMSQRMQWLTKILGPISIALFGYPLSVESRTRTRDVIRIINQLPKGDLVDIGCAFGGAQTFEFARRLAPHQVLGIDIDPVSIEVGQQVAAILQLDNLCFKTGDILTYEPTGQKFDIAFTSETLEHISDDERAIYNISQMIRSGGWLFVSVPYAKNPEEFEIPEPAFDDLSTNEGSQAFVGAYHYRSGYNESSLRRVVHSAGFSIESIFYTKTFSCLPNQPYFFPISYALSRLIAPIRGEIRKINILARKTNNTS